MKNEMMKSLEVSNLFGLKDKETKKVLRKTQIDTIHRDKNGDKSLIDREFINNLYDVISKLVELRVDKDELTQKEKKDFFKSCFLFLLSSSSKLNYYSMMVDTIFILNKKTKEILLDVIFTIEKNDLGYVYKLIDNKTNNEYSYGYKVNLIPTSNNRNYTPHTKSPHIVKTHIRRQPYGSKENPQYKEIIIKSFIKGVQKVG